MLLNCPLDAYRTFHRWLLLSGILVYAAYLIVANDLLTQMLETDQSYLSGVILLLLLATLVSMPCGNSWLWVPKLNSGVLIGAGTDASCSENWL